MLEVKYGISNEFTTKDVMMEAFGEFDTTSLELGDVLIDILDQRAKSPKSVGKLLGRLRDVVLRGLTLKDGKLKTFPAKWRIEKAV